MLGQRKCFPTQRCKVVCHTLIRGIQKTSLIDFPGNVAATIFVSGCNMRCPYCHNRDLVLETDGLPTISEDEVLAILRKRKGLLDGICITGGEPTLQRDLVPFIERVRALRLKIKLDTNGSNPAVLGELIGRGILDYVAMDIKGPRDRYAEITRSRLDLAGIGEAIRLIRGSGIDYEFRTTVVPGLIGEEDLLEIARWIEGARKYVLQQYKPGPTLDPSFSDKCPYERAWFNDVAAKLARFFEIVEIRGISAL